jgi:Sulfotransferase domain
MDRLYDRYVLSVILSFLTETEGTSLLICRKTWATRILPIFRLPQENKGNNQHPTKFRHWFIEYPVPDATTRLERLNTCKWRKKYKKMSPLQQQQYHNKSTKEMAKQEWISRHSKSTINNIHDEHVVSSPPLLQFWSPVLERSLQQQKSLFQPGITLLASYPRSGNTYVRSLLESITGFVTLSDTRADRPLSMALANHHGLVGEGRCGGPICKTHWPERMGCAPYKASRVILLVRNPYDAIDSYWHLNATNTHTQKVTPQVYQDHQALFQALTRNEMHVWSAFLDFYWQQRNNVPVLLVRYEDLMLHPQGELERILKFCTPHNWWHSQLQAVLATQHHQLGYQSVNAATSSVGRSLKSGIYQAKLLQELHEKMDVLDPNHWMDSLGYSQDCFPNNLTTGLPPLPQPKSVPPKTTLLPVNDSIAKELRPRDSPFGRNMRNWRRQHTKDDEEPFPTTTSSKQ